MSTRQKSTTIDARAGCYVCNGAEAKWTSRNAVAMAARHHDKTGHATWADQLFATRYGELGASQPDMFEVAS